MTKKIAILQSCYIPWKGYFDLINLADEFVLFDNVQYTRRDWRNRNLIKTSNGLQWLTIPVSVKGKYKQLISETNISNPNWSRKHWNTIKQFHRKSKFFSAYEARFEELYLNELASKTALSDINRILITEINNILGISTLISTAQDYSKMTGQNERLISICKESGSSIYITGPAARGYLDEELFKAEGISIQWMSYSGYAKYEQLYGDFEHGVSILDLIFNIGKDAHNYMNSFKQVL
ncbi:MAG: WbqC family protein [Xanthomonadales bacterium]|nr:WbqC family protein [Xanthomonadales bacterium]